MNNIQKEQKTLLLAGGSGFIGNFLGEALSKIGWKIKLLSRQNLAFQTSYPCTTIQWDGKKVPDDALDDVTAIINLAGESVSEGYWTRSQKKKILDSRINSTKAIIEAIQKARSKPEVLIQASAIGYYGMESKSKDCDENTLPGEDFLANVCKQWEAQLEPIKNQCRVCTARIGLVFGWEGGAFPKLWDIYTSSLGCILSNGEQWMNWIHIKDISNFFIRCLKDNKYQGEYNLVAPKNINNKNFHKLFCQYTSSWSELKAPSFAVSLFLGKKSDLILKGPRVLPKRLLDQNFNFEFSDLSSCLEDLMHERIERKAHYLKVKQWVPTSLDQVWSFVSQAENLEKITPPFLNFKIKSKSTKEIAEGTTIDYSLKLHGLPITWRSEISEWTPKKIFIDQQLKGPYKLWHHRHLFTPLENGTLIEDRVEYKLPLYPFGQMALFYINSDLKKIFAYRKEMTTKFLR